MSNAPLIKKTIAIVVCLLAGFLLISVSAALVYSLGSQNGGANPIAIASPLNPDGSPAELPPPDLPPLSNRNRRTPQRTNVLLLGLDDEAGLPDVILIGTYCGVTHNIDIISIPRDTHVYMTQQERDEISARGQWFPAHGNIKLNELHNYAGRAQGPHALRRRLGYIFDIEFDYHVVLDLRAFRHIVDAVGGIYVTLDAPLYYNQGGQIVINQPAGRHLRSGQDAEQIVRFRNAPAGDLHRIALQQNFMGEFFTQALTVESILSNPFAFINSLFDFVSSDIMVHETFAHARAVHNLRPDNITFHTAPGQARLQNGISFFFVDEAGAKEIMDTITAND